MEAETEAQIIAGFCPGLYSSGGNGTQNQIWLIPEFMSFL